MTLLSEVIAPLFFLISTGYIISKYRHIDVDSLADIALYICMPFMIFSALVTNPITGEMAFQVLIWHAGMYIVSILTVKLIARLANWDKPTRSAVTLSIPTVNVGSYGLAIVMFTLGEQGLSVIMLLFIYSNIFTSTLGVFIAAGSSRSTLAALANIFKLPLVYAVFIALYVQYTGLHVPLFFLNWATLVGKTGPIIAIILLGVQLAQIDTEETCDNIILFWSIMAKVVVGPIIGISLTWLIGAEGLVRQVLFIASCLPTAINALILSSKFKARPELLGRILIGSTLWSPINLLIILHLLEL